MKIRMANSMRVKGIWICLSGMGRPSIHIGPKAVRAQTQECEEICGLFGERIAQRASELFNKD